MRDGTGKIIDVEIVGNDGSCLLELDGVAYAYAWADIKELKSLIRKAEREAKNDSS